MNFTRHLVRAGKIVGSIPVHGHYAAMLLPSAGNVIGYELTIAIIALPAWFDKLSGKILANLNMLRYGPM